MADSIRRHVIGHELAYGGHGPEWALRADLDDGTSIYYPLPGGFDIPDVDRAPMSSKGSDLRIRMGELLAPISSRHPLWIHRRVVAFPIREVDTPLNAEKSAELSRKVDAALLAVEAALHVENARMERDG